jgi:hypothetical protein
MKAGSWEHDHRKSGFVVEGVSHTIDLRFAVNLPFHSRESTHGKHPAKGPSPQNYDE